MFDIDKKIQEWQDKNKQETGMPIINLNRETIQSLIQGARIGLSERLLASYARISRNTLDSWYVKFPDLKEELSQLKDKPKTRAIKNVIVKIKEGDIDTSKWYLEKTEKETFGNKVINENINYNMDELTDEEKQNIKDNL